MALPVNGGTPTYYLGSLEEVAGSTLTKYFSASGLPTVTGWGQAARRAKGRDS